MHNLKCLKEVTAMGRNRKGKWEEISFWAVERTKRTGLYYSKINEVRKFIKI